MSPVPALQFPCSSGKHRVALQAERYWDPAKCPVCGTRVDRFRARRVSRWIAGRAPRSRLRVPLVRSLSVLDGLAIGGLAGMIALGAALRSLGDSWWLGTVLLFVGRWPWIVPVILVLALATLTRSWRAAALSAIAFVVGLIWVLGMSLGTGRWFGDSDPATRIRIITFNAGSSDSAAASLGQLVEEWDPDVIAIQECGPAVKQAISRLAGYTTDRRSTCLATRLPMLEAAEMPRRDIQQIGGSGQAVRYRLRGPGGDLKLTNVHLETPRNGFERLIAGSPRAAGVIDRETTIREVESHRARIWANDHDSLAGIVVGDFNTPAESRIFRGTWGDLGNAFARAGIGFGYTKFTGLIQIRIDHVVHDRRWRAVHARVLPNAGSDHRPLLVDLERRSPAG